MRREETNVIRTTSYFRGLNFSLFNISSKLICFLTLLAYVLTGNILISEKVLYYYTIYYIIKKLISFNLQFFSIEKKKVFLFLTLQSNVRLSFALYFPLAITAAAEAITSIDRIQVFNYIFYE